MRTNTGATLLFLVFSFFIETVTAQTVRPLPPPAAIEAAPWWARQMYSEHPNVHQVDSAFMQWRKENPVGRPYFTQYYKHWRRAIGSHLTSDGYWSLPSPGEDEARFRNWQEARQQHTGRSTQWENLGPFKTYAEGEDRLVAWQVNVYRPDQSPSHPDVLYAGTENGLVFKSTDKGENWHSIAEGILTSGGIGAVKVHPTDPQTAYFGDRHRIYKTTNGGLSWSLALQVNDLRANAISIHPTDPDIVLVAAEKGLHRSTDGGETWSQVFAQKCWDMALKTNDPNTVFLLKNNPTTKLCEFFKSTDKGETWTKITNGWIDPAANSTADNNDGGARLAVTDADPDRIYAVLLGQYNDGVNDNNYLGVYRSNDAGESWTLPNANANGGPGGPYAGNHTCLATFWFNNAQRYPNSGYEYEQGYYNLAIGASDSDPDRLLVGFLNLFKSEDGGLTFQRWGGYGGGPGWQHPDIQCIDIKGDDVWVCSDGGINKYAPDFSSHEAKCTGMAGSDFWGFDGGWNEDVMTGGRYHNGNTATIFGTYTNGEFIRLGGAEATTGYVHPAGGRKVMHSDISPKILPLTVTGPTSGFNFSAYPNEGYAGNNENSSEIEPDPRCYNHLYIGHENKLQKSLDGGISWSTVFTFGNNSSRIVTGIEIGRSNPDVIYLVQNDDSSRLWKSVDGGQTFALTNPPPGAVSGAFISLDPLDENRLWLAWNRGGSNTNKVFLTTDGGATWTNLTTPALNGHHVEQICHIGGTEGGVYLATDLGVFYRNQNDTDWMPCSDGLPVRAAINRLVPFYAKGKVRIATYGSGIWQADFVEMPGQPIVQPTVDKLVANCARDTFYFDDYSMVHHDGATWGWTFDPAPQYVSATDVRNPKVVFGTSGSYTATMTLNGSFTKSLALTVNSACDAEHVPGQALQLDGNGHAAANANLDLHSNTVTITCWVKANPAQNAWAPFVFARGGNTTVGIGLGDDFGLRYHWNGNHWWWNSGLALPTDIWTHVALVVTPASATIYLNGIAAVNTAAHAPEPFDSPLLIGWDPNSDSRRFHGLVDEVAVWKKALTQADIRELMHLTKIPAEQPDLVSYYQFNETTGQVMDRTGVRHLSLVGSAVQTTSTAPLGGGTSARLTLAQPGEYVFGETGLTVTFAPGNTLPGGEVVVSRINLPPDQLPNASPHSQAYWAVNNYGPNQLFDEPTSIRFGEYGEIPPGAAPADYLLYARGAFDDGDTWGNPFAQANELTPGPDGAATFTTGNGVATFGQFVVMREPATLSSWNDFQAALLPNGSVRLYWTVQQSPGLSHFILEKSADGLDFQFFTKINARTDGHGNYHAMDASTFRGHNFYRLVQVAQDGKTTHAAVRQVFVEGLPNDWAMFPNPLPQGRPLEIRTNVPDAYRLLIYDTKGRAVHEKTLRGDAVLTGLHLTKGAYSYQILSGERRLAGKLVVVE